MGRSRGRKMSPVASGLVIGGIVLAVTLIIGGVAVAGAFTLVVVGLNSRASNK